jgi:hypothetical protein
MGVCAREGLEMPDGSVSCSSDGVSPMGYRKGGDSKRGIEVIREGEGGGEYDTSWAGNARYEASRSLEITKGSIWVLETDIELATGSVLRDLDVSKAIIFREIESKKKVCEVDGVGCVESDKKSQC